jgi:hypothetical protein
VSRKRRAEVPVAEAVGGGGGGGGGGGLPLARGLDPEEDSEEEDSEEEEAPIVGVVPAHASAAALLAFVAAHSRFVPLPPLPSEVLDELVLHLPTFGFQKNKKRCAVPGARRCGRSASAIASHMYACVDCVCVA